MNLIANARGYFPDTGLVTNMLSSFIVQGLGYLTRLGKQGSLQVGEVFRHFYKNFLSDSPRDVWARSSTYPRCFETEYLLLGEFLSRVCIRP